MTKNIRIILSLVGIFFIGIIIFTIFSVFTNSQKKTGLEITTIPKGTTIDINGVTYKPGFVKLEPGTYKISISKNGYQTAESNVTVDAQDTPTQKYFSLTPVSKEARAESRKDTESIEKIEAEAGEQSAEAGKAFEAKYPIAKNLPFRSLLYNIDYKRTGENKQDFVVLITADSPINRGYAINQIKNWGLRPSDYEIEFRYISNPFKEKDQK